MAAATVTTRFPHKQAEEHLVLTITDEYTHDSRLSKPEMCQITEAEDMGSETNSTSYSISGRTISFHAAGVSSKKIGVIVYGTL